MDNTSHSKYPPRIIARLRSASKKRGISFNLTASDIVSLDKPLHCPILGLLLDYNASERVNRDNTASLDRIDSSKGYEPSNLQWISFRANRMKQNATLEEVAALFLHMFDMKIKEPQYQSTQPTS